MIATVIKSSLQKPQIFFLYLKFSSYTFHYSSLLKRSDYPEEEAIYSTKHQKQQKRSSFEGSDQTSCQHRPRATAPGKHPAINGGGSPPGPPTHRAPQGEPANLPAVFCSSTAAVVGTVGRGRVFRSGGRVADPGLRLRCFLCRDPSKVKRESMFFSPGGNDKEEGNMIFWH